MKELIILFIKGFIIGVAKMIPGVSGSVLAISLGVYEKLLRAVNKFFNDPIKNIKFLLPIGTGILIAIIFTSKLLIYAITNYQMPTLFLFIGLIMGGIPSIYKKIPIKKLNLFNILLVLIPFLVVAIPTFTTNLIVDKTTTNFFIIFGLGMIDAVSTIIPGLSGTALFMMIGYYNFVITNIGNASFNNLNILFPFGLGFMITIILLVKVMHYLLENHNNKTYLAIIGFTLSSIVIILYKALSISFTIPLLLISIVMLVAGIFIGLRFEE